MTEHFCGGQSDRRPDDYQIDSPQRPCCFNSFTPSPTNGGTAGEKEGNIAANFCGHVGQLLRRPIQIPGMIGGDNRCGRIT
jgi:hypothetical protein